MKKLIQDYIKLIEKIPKINRELPKVIKNYQGKDLVFKINELFDKYHNQDKKSPVRYTDEELAELDEQDRIIDYDIV